MGVTWPNVAQLLVFGIQTTIWVGCALVIVRLRRHSGSVPSRPRIVNGLGFTGLLAFLANVSAALALTGLLDWSATVQLGITVAELAAALICVRVAGRRKLAEYLQRLLRGIATLTTAAAVLATYLALTWLFTPNEVELTYAGGSQPTEQFDCGPLSKVAPVTACWTTYTWWVQAPTGTVDATVEATFELRRDPGGPIGARHDRARVRLLPGCDTDLEWNVTVGRERFESEDGATSKEFSIPADGDRLRITARRRGGSACSARFELVTPWQT